MRSSSLGSPAPGFWGVVATPKQWRSVWADWRCWSQGRRGLALLLLGWQGLQPAHVSIQPTHAFCKSERKSSTGFPHSERRVCIHLNLSAMSRNLTITGYSECVVSLNTSNLCFPTTGAARSCWHYQAPVYAVVLFSPIHIHL